MSSRHRRGDPPPESSSSSDEEDVFSSLKLKKRRVTGADDEVKHASAANVPTTSQVSESSEASNKPATNNLPVKAPVTSSMKRHHGAISSSRKAKMDALLQELNAEKINVNQKPPSSQRVSGSFVQPGEENITTNLFVGNLAPHLTEEQVYDVFVQFGPLHSVKIMWARTPEERSRNRHSGFVCFRHRADAEAALNELDDTDAFRVGRHIMVRWGRHVPHHNDETSTRSNNNNNEVSTSIGHIQVVVPPDPEREHFISTVASKVVREESPLEQKLQQEPEFSCNDAERNYYLWRVWSFEHGDSFTSWCTEPFIMQEGGPKWIPPPLHQVVDEKEKIAASRSRGLYSRRRHGGSSDGRKLTTREVEEFDILFRRELTTSRGAICKAMAFCFDKSGSFQQICEMLQDLIQEEPARNVPKDVAIEQKTAQLFVLSDILFNSQQPGVRNAFRYRDAIEKMAPEIFTALGKMDWGGRLTRNKLAVEISAILGAWTNWSVYNPSFLDELHDRFEGRTVKQIKKDVETSITKDDDGSGENTIERELNETKSRSQSIDKNRMPNNGWADVETPSKKQNEAVNRRHNSDLGVPLFDAEMQSRQPGDGGHLNAKEIDGKPLEEDVDGEPIGEDADGEPLDDNDVDGEPIDKGTDGEPIGDGDVDGELIEEDADGEPLSDDDVDGELLDNTSDNNSHGYE